MVLGQKYGGFGAQVENYNDFFFNSTIVQQKGIAGKSLQGRTGDLCVLFKPLTSVLSPSTAGFNSDMLRGSVLYFISSFLKSQLLEQLPPLREKIDICNEDSQGL